MFNYFYNGLIMHKFSIFFIYYVNKWFIIKLILDNMEV